MYEIVDFNVHDANSYSDHVIVSFAISTCMNYNEFETDSET